MNDDLAALKKCRSIVKAACTRIKNYTDGISSMSPALIPQLEERKVKLEQHWADYNNLQTHLELLNDSEITDRITFKETFYNFWQEHESYCKSLSATRSVAVPSIVQISESFIDIRFSKLDFLKFIIYIR